jgi:CubicO group peptidase (beta-lactamase class C family)
LSRSKIAILLGCLVLVAVAIVIVPRPDRPPRDRKLPVETPFRWEIVAPESEGLSRDALEQLRERLEQRGTDAFLVVKRDRLVYEWYAPGWEHRDGHFVASLAKGLVGGISLMLASCDGRIGLDDAVAKHVPEWSGDPERSQVTVRHLATHASGIPHASKTGRAAVTLERWEREFWSLSPDPFSRTIRDAPVLTPPGTAYRYSGPAFAVLTYAVTASLKGAAEDDILTLLDRRIMDPLGIPGSQWSIGYRESFTVDGMDLFPTWGGGEYSARATARVGQFLAHRGEWGGEQLVRKACVDEMMVHADTPRPEGWERRHQPLPALGWWSNVEGSWPTAPRDAFAGLGAGHQVLFVVPSLDLVVVRYGTALGEDSWDGDYWVALEREIIRPVMALVSGSAKHEPRGGIR